MAQVGSGKSGRPLIGQGSGVSPTFADIGTQSGLTAHGVLLAQGANAFTATGAGTVGQVLTSNGSGLDPSFQSGIYISLSPYIVGTDSHSSFVSISSAIAQAVADGASSTNPANIYIKPKTTGGAYTENLTLSDRINLIGFSTATKIIGKISASFAGTASLTGIYLQTNSDNLLAVTGSAATIINVNECYLNCSNNTGISYTTASASSQLNLYQCEGDIATTGIGLHTISSSGTFAMHFSRFTNTGGSSTVSTISAGVVNYLNSYMNSPITSSGTSSVGMNYFKMSTSGQNATCFTCGGAGATANNCGFASGSATAIICNSTTELTNGVVNSTNAAAISGSNSVKVGCITFDGSSSTVTASTQIPQITFNDAVNVVSAVGSSYTTKAQDGLILVNGATTATIVPLASPTTGQKHIIKDNAGTAGSNNITITPSGKNIDGVASFVINVNYGSISIVYSGSEWSIY